MITVDTVSAAAYEIPTDEPESDGTLEWESTTVVVVHCRAGGTTGMGYTYGPKAVAALVGDELASVVEGRDALRVDDAWLAMGAALRNVGRPGIGMMAVSAVDTALWDLKARLLGVAVVDLLGGAHDAVPIYGSGGFCTYSLERLQEQLGGWVDDGIPRVKMKTSRHPDEDSARLDAARKAIGDETDLYVDANGALLAEAGAGLGGALPERLGRELVRGAGELRTTSTGCGCCATAGPPASTSPPASTATSSPTSGTCSTPAQSTACRPTSPAAAASPACSA